MTVKTRSDNRILNERPTGTAIRAAMDAEQAHRRALERTMAEAMRLPPGPRPTATTEPVPAHRRPVVRVR
jgi:hypothetical protein